MLSHASAAWLWGLQPRCASSVHVSVPSRGQRRANIELHHSSTLSSEEWGRMGWLRVTALPRTLLDLAAVELPRRLWNAVERTERLGHLKLTEIDAMLGRRKGHRGAGRLRGALEIYRDPVFSRARSERLFLDLCKRSGLPRPKINTWVDQFEIDAFWKDERFAVEVDGWDSHRTRTAFENDLLRQEEMKLAGIDSIRVSARRIERAPSQVGHRLAILLSRRRAELGLPS
jgi:very-short-patch-repair endonuclease